MNKRVSFREQVIELVRSVPRGSIVSYGQVARVLGRPRAARAVGAVMKFLPIDDDLTPWHRVVNHKGGISKRSDIFAQKDPKVEQRERLQDEGLEPDVSGNFNLAEHGLCDSTLRSYFGCEMLELVDRDNRLIGVAPRIEVRRDNLLHRGVGILCWNSQGELYVHQRTATKDLFASFYDMMVGGALEAGESYQAAALREVQEELGVGNVSPQFLLETLYEGPKNRSWIQLFEVYWNGPIVWQKEEICWGRWMSFSEVLEWIRQVPIVPDGLQVFQHYLKREKQSRRHFQ